MINRYTRPEMGSIWSDEQRFSIWLSIEVLACEAQALQGIIPQEAVDEIREKAAFDVDRILEIEKETKHDVIAFTTNVAEYVGPASRFIHLGMTSSDVLDTCLAVQLQRAGNLLVAGLEGLSAVLKTRALEFKHTQCIGRTHGIHAEVTTFGLKLLLWHQEIQRDLDRLQQAIRTISVGMISGAVGTFEHLSPFVEEYVCEKLGLKPASVSTQVIQRDRHAEFMTTLAIIGTTLEKIGTEIRHLQRTEVREAEESFTKGQKGSSAMPHKKNPIVSERLCGLARVLRANALTALENNALWHERDISHSSVERITCPDSTIVLDYMISLATALIDNLVVYPDTMVKNLNVTNGLPFSQSVLLALVRKGCTREDAYKMVQSSAMRTWETSVPLKQTLLENQEIAAFLTASELENIFDDRRMLKNVDLIFARCGLTDQS
ncbi:MAG: adenylosuccinate lyase [Chlorobi bacterium]|nr:MAG: adenylosuccinate lyase [Bacteroidota bacterium]KXK35339.1 MAG: adenylosuccinate lyase [Chlorobi bacterium OLB6]MBE2265082.1 adenylosuccinate lyase [Flavobacteriales bacterium]MBL1160755.1 adenylosuccinate lyase [Chlorobiota bacterium]MBW7853106.1 adenylosuccinate lyase [Candidatus Kapabacteria bacterium]MCC6331405.1 adenylosuccinate lyase [Ignavibacteria bacterium]